MAAEPDFSDLDASGWFAVCTQDRLKAKKIVCAIVNGVSLIVVWDGDIAYACERACPHEQADLAQGRVENGKLYCPRHLAWFDLVSGGGISPGWTSPPLRRFPLREREAKIWVNVT